MAKTEIHGSLQRGHELRGIALSGLGWKAEHELQARHAKVVIAVLLEGWQSAAARRGESGNGGIVPRGFGEAAGFGRQADGVG